MAKVVDPSGVQWWVRRKWYSPNVGDTGFEFLDMLIFIVMLPFLVAWPFWLVAKWLGVPWLIVIERDGKEVGREHVRGWRRSRARVEELTAGASNGMLTQFVA